MKIESTDPGGLPGRQARGESAKVLHADGTFSWILPRHYRFTYRELWDAIAGDPSRRNRGPATCRADHIEIEPPPLACLLAIPVFIPPGPVLPCGDLLILAQPQDTEGLSLNEQASRLAGRPILGHAVLISPQGDPRKPHDSISRHAMKPRFENTKYYVALGDSMSIDRYTGKAGGGAVAQFFNKLCQRGEQSNPPTQWQVIDESYDGCVMSGVPMARGDCGVDLITLTIGGNDLLQNMHRDIPEYIPHFQSAYRVLMGRLQKRVQTVGGRSAPERVQEAVVVVGNIYKPAAEYPREMEQALDEVNRFIDETVAEYGFRLADIHGAFLGHEEEYLCLSIEPTLKGATVIADLFDQAAFPTV